MLVGSGVSFLTTSSSLGGDTGGVLGLLAGFGLVGLGAGMATVRRPCPSRGSLGFDSGGRRPGGPTPIKREFPTPEAGAASGERNVDVELLRPTGTVGDLREAAPGDLREA